MVIVISHAKEINKTNIIFIETSCHFMNRKSFRNFRGILNIIWLRQQFRYRHVNWCYAADGFVCILSKIFCILYQAFVRHFIFNPESITLFSIKVYPDTLYFQSFRLCRPLVPCLDVFHCSTNILPLCYLSEKPKQKHIVIGIGLYTRHSRCAR